MGAIINILQGVANFISSVVNFIVDFFRDLVYVIGLLTSFIVNIPGYFGWLPTTVAVLVVTTFGVVIIYLVLGRE